MTEIDWILRRRSIRKFIGQKPTSDQIRLLLEAAMAAPTALNLKPWKFIIVQDENWLSELHSTLPFR